MNKAKEVHDDFETLSYENQKRVGQDILLVDDSNTITTLKTTDFYKNLTSDEETMLTQILTAFDGRWGSFGFDSKGLSIVFPYMAPDNDSAMSSLFFEDLFLNPNAMKNIYKKQGEAVKILEKLKTIE